MLPKFIIATALAAYLVNLAFAEDDALHLEVGDQTKLGIAASELMLSRRGIIDIRELSEESWQISALRAGAVLITARDDAGKEVKRILVKVRNEPHRTKLPATFIIPEELCNEQGVRCDQRFGVIAGVTSSIEVFVKAQRYCRGSKHCLVQLRLSELAKAELKGEIEAKLGPEFHVSTTYQGTILAETPCFADNDQDDRSEWADFLSGGLVEVGVLKVRCVPQRHAVKYFVSARILQMNKSDTSQFGWNKETRAKILSNPKRLRKDWDLLSSSVANAYGKVIAEPTIRLNPGVEGQVQSGGEFQVIYETGSKDQPSKKGWKKIGIDFKTKIIALTTNTARLAYQMSLVNRPPAGSGRILNTSALSGEVDLEFDKYYLVGEIDVNGDGNESDEAMLLASVPIIGPFFRLLGTEKSMSRMYVLLVASQDGGGELVPEKREWPGLDR